MTNRQFFFVIGLVAAAIVFVGWTIFERISPTQRAMRKAKRGDIGGAIADLTGLLQKGESASARNSLGQVYLLADRPEEAASELRKAVELGSRSAGTLNALGWALVRLDRLEEALPIAEEAHKKAREDFEVYCLYCGLMARNGRAREVAPLYESLKQTAAQIQKMNAAAFRNGLDEKFEFARTHMTAAGIA